MTTAAETVAEMTRRDVLGVLVSATGEELRAIVGGLEPFDEVADLRSPEIGLVMLRGRIGGDGAPFNIGEGTAARAVVRLASGEVGYGYRLGRNTIAARYAAIIDALWQVPAYRRRIEEMLIPVSERIQVGRVATSREAASSRVDFFTLAREAT